MDLEGLKKSFLKKFQEETADRLQKIQLAVLDLEKSTSAVASETVARELHTMKGEARILGLNAIGQMAHAAEDVLKSSQDQKITLRIATDMLLRACDCISDLVDQPEQAADGTSAVAELCGVLAATSGYPVPALKPGLPSISNGQKMPSSGVVSSADAVSPSAGPPPSKGSIHDRSIRVNVEVLDSLGLSAGDLLVESARAKLRSRELSELFGRVARMNDRYLRLGDRLRRDAKMVPELDLLESDLHLLRDDSFRFARRNSDGNNTLHGNLAHLADTIAEARLVPLSTVFEAFPRAVREIARQQAKQVDLAIDNLEVGVDRSVLADVRDALVHLLRNAVDHGIEAPDFRQGLGKPREGRISIRARSDGDMLHVEVEDDGRGIDPERMRLAAVAKKLVSTSAAAALSDREAIDFVFVAGFSTRDEVSDLSGRGVGMDVVKRKVEALGGSVSIVSRVSRGTTVALRLPQSLALMRVLLVRLGSDIYGVPAADVEAVTRIRPADRIEVFGTVSVNHRGKPVVLVALGPLLGLNGGPSHDHPPAIIVRHGGDLAALVVDGFVDEREVAVKPCGGEFLAGAAFIAGTAALEDGRIAVLLHLPDVMTETRRLTRPVTSSAPARKLRVLLVDDSPIARATESALVKALGHSVDEAIDGEDAYVKLKSQSYDILLTDLQMPKMDGFTLTRRIKSTPGFGHLPIIILSSLASPEDRRRGLDAGADAYLIKGELGVESLAQAIDRLI